MSWQQVEKAMISALNMQSVGLAAALCVAGLLVCGPDVFGQGADPFLKSDPLSQPASNRRAADPIEIQFKVTDPSGSPLAGMQIRGPGISHLYTGQDGTVTWDADQNVLRDWAARLRGRLRYHAIPPDDLVLLSVSTATTFRELLQTKSVSFQTAPGVKLTGRVIGQDDRQPIQGVTVTVRSEQVFQAKREWNTSTDAGGNWDIVVPHADAKITLSGHRDGYRLNDSAPTTHDDAQLVSIPQGRSEFQVADLEVEQIQPLQVIVTDTAGKPIPRATVGVYCQRWLDDQIVVWDSLATGQQTGVQGTCALYLREASPQESDQQATPVSATTVFASTTEGDTQLSGRALVNTMDETPVRVVVQPLAKIGGVLRNNNRPLQNAELVLYEATPKTDTDCKTIGLRDETTTNDQGHYVFNAPVGLHYIVATKARDKNGIQQVLHRTSKPTSEENYRIPDLDVATLSRP
ncbi:hypothetical protein NHH03_22160 [Stieleria sp. TO1_6]|uniref:hypothetical protein n=1 Tax=Stieleria tagensis TaxID=2956795 RepID=UPI00209A8080|nr:hypothetical protein [Stieleria tagensis]MCO8124460.1 hypothetical protein [Stieleria tagensis]